LLNSSPSTKLTRDEESNLSTGWLKDWVRCMKVMVVGSARYNVFACKGPMFK
jgi:hypothetical protein